MVGPFRGALSQGPQGPKPLTRREADKLYQPLGTAGELGQGTQGPQGAQGPPGVGTQGPQGLQGQPGTATITGPDTPPASASTWDDEFNGNALDTKWVWVNQGAATAVVNNGSLKLTAPQTTANRRMLVQSAPSGNYVITCKSTLLSVIPGNYNQVGLVLRDSGTGRFTEFGGYANTASNGVPFIGVLVANWVSFSAFSSAPYGASDFQTTRYLKIIISNNITYQWSYDGYYYVTSLVQAKSNWLANINQIGVVVDCNGTTTGPVTHVVDWFRVT